VYIVTNYNDIVIIIEQLIEAVNEEVKKMCNTDLRNEMRIANVRQWEVADAVGVSEMTMVKWLRKELNDEKKALVRRGIAKAAAKHSNTT
jgi:hypothetical protein